MIEMLDERLHYRNDGVGLTIRVVGTAQFRLDLTRAAVWMLPLRVANTLQDAAGLLNRQISQLHTWAKCQQNISKNLY